MLITLGKYYFSEQEKLGLSRIRTGDLWVTSPSLYQQSYQPDGIFEPNQSQPFLHTHMATRQSHAELVLYHFESNMPSSAVYMLIITTWHF